ncbi:head-tail connector protein, partial [Bacillus toyonensis]
MLDVVKKALRISHHALDDEITDVMEAARHDLMLSGVSSTKVNVDADPLIKRAIITYTKA